MRFLNISAYKFVAIEAPEGLQTELRQRCAAAKLKGTILLAPEGINLFLAGTEAGVRGVLAWLTADPRLAGLPVKESWSDEQPFNRMLVKIKSEIITMRQPMIRPMDHRAPHIDAPTLKDWLDQGRDDEGREIALLDTRNVFEVEIGSFENALTPALKSFGEFPQQLAKLDPQLKEKTVVTFCTGGIRCEKAALYMAEQGYAHVYQLEILRGSRRRALPGQLLCVRPARGADSGADGGRACGVFQLPRRALARTTGVGQLCEGDFVPGLRGGIGVSD